MASLSEATLAIRFAKMYVALVEALMREGVAEDVARDEARNTAMIMSRVEEDVPHYDPAKGACPLCGQG